MHPTRRALLVALLFAFAACHPDFQITQYPTNEALYRAASKEYAAQHWDNAVAAFEKLTTDLPARDTLLPRAYWYLAQAHENRDELVLAATAFSHLVESFPDDSLAPRAALESARAYKRMWRKPALDPNYGETALSTYNTLLGLYSDSPLAPTARKELADVQEMFAQKNYLTGMYYFRRGGWDSGIIYFKDVLAKYPNTPSARLAQLRLVDTYKVVNYKPEASEVCASLRKSFPGDADVKLTCTGVADITAELPVTTTNSPPATTGPPVKAPPTAPPAS